MRGLTQNQLDAMPIGTVITVSMRWRRIIFTKSAGGVWLSATEILQGRRYLPAMGYEKSHLSLAECLDVNLLFDLDVEFPKDVAA